MSRRPILRGTVLAAVIVLSSFAAVHAQARLKDRPPRPGNQEAGDIHETIQLWILHRMRMRLELTDEQSLKLMELMDQRRAEERALRDRQKAIGRRLHALVEAPSATDAEYRAAIRDSEALESDRYDLRERIRRVEDGLFTPRQQVLRRVYAPKIRREIQQRFNRVREMERMGRRPRDLNQRSDRPFVEQRLDRLRETDPALYNRIRERLESGEQLTLEEREELEEKLRAKRMERRRRQMQESRRNAEQL